ncbi:GNAT family N-acetyltransferase [Loktanella sp. M215]|uniref:GNAT family N-acetyltransferase n=1 Tax=Loktanella sp. M215 TaxID=2675431 RepID=UPI001F1C905A|nr:GNAT family N-acetyltransferase [Loktanella sp. M215]MCF7697743.1 GNAT family N-acetyltransferase [Loktanella sp. M215]
MTITVALADPRSAEGLALLNASHAYLLSLYPPEFSFALNPDQLAEPHVRFFIAARDGAAMGCAALSNKGTYGEVKSMFVHPDARGTGTGAALMQTLEDEARAQNLPLMRLETGDDLYPAHRLYRRHGFTDCGPFGDYVEGPHSVFMEKRL